MKRTIILCIICIINIYACISQELSFKYLGQTEPTDTPKVFYLPVLEGGAAERIAISSDYKEIYFTEIHPGANTEHIIKYFNFENGNWYGPHIFNENNNEYGPWLSPDNNMLFINGDYSVRTDTEWAKPVRFINNNVVHCAQLTNQGNYYFLSYVNDSTTDVFKAIITEKDTILEAQGLNIRSRVQNDYFMDPDEEFILTSLNKTEIECYGGKDIFIRYRTPEGWTKPVNLGKRINTEHTRTNFGMCLSPDKKHMFYTQIDEGKVYIFWVRVDELFEELKERVD